MKVIGDNLLSRKMKCEGEGIRQQNENSWRGRASWKRKKHD
jgi:hypothetical protein